MTILPSVPVPLTNFKFIPLSSASFFANGDALISREFNESAEGKDLLEETVGLGAGGATLTEGCGLISDGIGNGVGAGLDSSFSTDSIFETFSSFSNLDTSSPFSPKIARIESTGAV